MNPSDFFLKEVAILGAYVFNWQKDYEGVLGNNSVRGPSPRKVEEPM